MKPANFPGRKNERRKRALKRLREQLTTWGRHRAGYIQMQISTLEQLIVPDHQARAIRTKKRGGRQVGRPPSDT